MSLRRQTVLLLFLLALGRAGAQITLPSLSPIPDQVVLEDAPAEAIPFTVDYGTFAPEDILVGGTSDNPPFPSPTFQVVLGGSGQQRTVTVIPTRTNYYGTVVVSILLGSAQLGLITNQSFRFTVLPVNDPPYFSIPGDISVPFRSGSVSNTSWAAQIAVASPPRFGESEQTVLGFTVASNSNPDLFEVPPAVALNGTLTFTPVIGRSGSATIHLTLRDSGGGQDTSAPRAFTITVREPRDIRVTNTDDSGPGSLRQAAADSTVEPAIITFDPALSGQTILLASEISLFPRNYLRLDATALPEGITVSGGNTARVFRCLGVSPGMIDPNFTLLLVQGITFTLGRSSSWGGAIETSGGKVTLEDCRFTQNTASSGGAIHYSGLELTLARCHFDSNTAGNGGAIYADHAGSLTLDLCRFVGNSASASGAAVKTFEIGHLSVTECEFAGNDAAQSGGALYTANLGGNATTEVTRCTFSNNSAGNMGGAFFLSEMELVMRHCTFFGNSAPTGGGLVVGSFWRALLQHCTLSGNTANVGGGVLASMVTSGSRLSLENSIVAGNQTPDPSKGKDVYLERVALDLLVANVIQDIDGIPKIVTGPAPLTGDPLLSALGDHGGPTPTLALRTGSPARDAAAGSAILTDQRGEPVVGIPDVGAYEAGPPRMYRAWSAESLGAVTDFAADSDADGGADGFEYAAGTDPGQVNSSPLSELVFPTNGTTRLVFPYNPDALDVVYTAQRARDLTPPGDAWVDQYALDGGVETVTDGITAVADPGARTITLVDHAPGERAYWRLQARQKIAAP